MTDKEIQAQRRGLDLIKEKGLYVAYAEVCNEIFDNTGRWPQNIDQEKLEADKATRDYLANQIAEEILKQNGWFLDHTYYHDFEWKQEGLEFSPGDPAECQGNGKHPGFECCCDNCDYFQECFPNWKEELQED